MFSLIINLRSLLVSGLLALITALLSYAAIDVWHASHLTEMPDHDYYAEIKDLKSQGKVGEALAICKYVQTQDKMPNHDAIVALGVDIEREQASWFGKCSRFGSGFLSGKMNSSEATVGAVVSDFLIVGDIRDLGYQGYNAATGKEVDMMVVTLSSLGALGSAFLLIPEPAEPVVAGGEAGISLLKGLRKINAISNRFARQTIEMAKEAIQTKKLGRIGEVFEHLGLIAKRVPAGTMGTAMKNVESVEDLKVISRWTRIAPNETITALSINGKEASGWLKSVQSSSGKMLGQTLRKGAAGFSETRPFLRGGKLIYRGGLGDIRERVVDWLENHSGARKLLFWVGLGGFLLSGLLALGAFVKLYQIFRIFRPAPVQSL